MADAMIGVIGGSGLYEIDGLEGAEWRRVETPWGEPSDAILTGTLDGVAMAFLPRHGRGHVHTPTSVPYRANIDAMKRLGVTDLIGVSAVGSFRDEMAPGDFVMVDQFIDRTSQRARSFFGPGCVAHVSVASPTCPRLGSACEAAAREVGVTVHRSGTYLAMEGPQFSTLAESQLYRERWGCDVVGMTNMPEAKLAREAELCYAAVAMVTDYDSWHPRPRRGGRLRDRARAPGQRHGRARPDRAPAGAPGGAPRRLPRGLRPRARARRPHPPRVARPRAGGQARRGRGPRAVSPAP